MHTHGLLASCLLLLPPYSCPHRQDAVVSGCSCCCAAWGVRLQALSRSLGRLQHPIPEVLAAWYKLQCGGQCLMHTISAAGALQQHSTRVNHLHGPHTAEYTPAVRQQGSTPTVHTQRSADCYPHGAAVLGSRPCTAQLQWGSCSRFNLLACSRRGCRQSSAFSRPKQRQPSS